MFLKTSKGLFTLSITICGWAQCISIHRIPLTACLEFNFTVRDFVCPWHWLLIDFTVIRNCAQKFVLITDKNQLGII